MGLLDVFTGAGAGGGAAERAFEATRTGLAGAGAGPLERGKFIRMTPNRPTKPPSVSRSICQRESDPEARLVGRRCRRKELNKSTKTAKSLALVSQLTAILAATD
jgi:hypothetical protein